MSLTSQIKELARDLGFSLAGITTPDPPPHLDIYLDWIAQEHHGEMAYLAQEHNLARRANPRKILPDCRSILVLGIPYANPSQASQDSFSGKNPSGKVAAYAWGEDYHDILVERLQLLHARIERLVNAAVPARWYTDTGPILERDLAQRAGLGWIGKNTCLINPHSGSYYFLAEMLLGIELDPDAAFTADRCGSCQRCIQACPTACILPDRTLDASRCISYLTIELRGPIPPELRPKLGDWVFGCDICQEVCPWNLRFAPQMGDSSFIPRPGVPRPDLLAELQLSPEDYNRKFKGTPIKRAKRRGYLRNVVVALGNGGDVGAVSTLVKVLNHEQEPLVRAHAAWALGQIGGSEARQALELAVEQEVDLDVRAEIRQAIDLSSESRPM